MKKIKRLFLKIIILSAALLQKTVGATENSVFQENFENIERDHSSFLQVCKDLEEEGNHLAFQEKLEPFKKNPDFLAHNHSAFSKIYLNILEETYERFLLRERCTEIWHSKWKDRLPALLHQTYSVAPENTFALIRNVLGRLEPFSWWIEDFDLLFPFASLNPQFNHELMRIFGERHLAFLMQVNLGNPNFREKVKSTPLSLSNLLKVSLHRLVSYNDTQTLLDKEKEVLKEGKVALAYFIARSFRKNLCDDEKVEIILNGTPQLLSHERTQVYFFSFLKYLETPLLHHATEFLKNPQKKASVKEKMVSKFLEKMREKWEPREPLDDDFYNNLYLFLKEKQYFQDVQALWTFMREQKNTHDILIFQFRDFFQLPHEMFSLKQKNFSDVVMQTGHILAEKIEKDPEFSVSSTLCLFILGDAQCFERSSSILPPGVQGPLFMNILKDTANPLKERSQFLSKVLELSFGPENTLTRLEWTHAFINKITSLPEPLKTHGTLLARFLKAPHSTDKYQIQREAKEFYKKHPDVEPDHALKALPHITAGEWGESFYYIIPQEYSGISLDSHHNIWAFLGEKVKGPKGYTRFFSLFYFDGRDGFMRWDPKIFRGMKTPLFSLGDPYFVVIENGETLYCFDPVSTTYTVRPNFEKSPFPITYIGATDHNALFVVREEETDHDPQSSEFLSSSFTVSTFSLNPFQKIGENFRFFSSEGANFEQKGKFLNIRTPPKKESTGFQKTFHFMNIKGEHYTETGESQRLRLTTVNWASTGDIILFDCPLDPIKSQLILLDTTDSFSNPLRKVFDLQGRIIENPLFIPAHPGQYGKTLLMLEKQNKMFLSVLDLDSEKGTLLWETPLNIDHNYVNIHLTKDKKNIYFLDCFNKKFITIETETGKKLQGAVFNGQSRMVKLRGVSPSGKPYVTLCSF